MDPKINKKVRLLYLMQLLNKYTDENNPVSTNEIIKYFAQKDISVSRKTVKDDIDALVEAGYDVVTVKSSYNSFFWNTRIFQLSEVKLLMDAVIVSNFIVRDKKEELIEKLLSCTSLGYSTQISRHLYNFYRVKADDEQLYDTVETINDAINKRKKIHFQYIEFIPNKEKVLKNKGELFVIDPYAIILNEGHYFLLGYFEKNKNILIFRVDYMYRPKVTTVELLPPPIGFNAVEIAKELFESDEKKINIDIECDKLFLEEIIDKFGEEIEIKKINDTIFKTRINTKANSQFYGWVFQHYGKIKIVAPLTIKDEYKKMIEMAIQE